MRSFYHLFWCLPQQHNSSLAQQLLPAFIVALYSITFIVAFTLWSGKIADKGRIKNAQLPPIIEQMELQKELQKELFILYFWWFVRFIMCRDYSHLQTSNKVIFSSKGLFERKDCYLRPTKIGVVSNPKGVSGVTLWHRRANDFLALFLKDPTYDRYYYYLLWPPGWFLECWVHMNGWKTASWDRLRRQCQAVGSSFLPPRVHQSI